VAGERRVRDEVGAVGEVDVPGEMVWCFPT